MMIDARWCVSSARTSGGRSLGVIVVECSVFGIDGDEEEELKNVAGSSLTVATVNSLEQCGGLSTARLRCYHICVTGKD